MRTRHNWAFILSILLFVIGDVIYLYAPIEAGYGFPIFAVFFVFVIPVITYFFVGNLMENKNWVFETKYRISLTMLLLAIVMFAPLRRSTTLSFDFPASIGYNDLYSFSGLLIFASLLSQALFFSLNKDVFPSGFLRKR